MIVSGSPEWELARQLAGAFEMGSPPIELPDRLLPSGADAAYAIQLEILKRRNTGIAGWKVGAKSPTGPIQGAPLPCDRVHRDALTLSRNGFVTLGLELEIAFSFGRAFRPSEHPYSEDEVLAGVKFMAAAIEVVSSRFVQWPQVEKLGQLADLQNHGALVVGQVADYQHAYPFARPALKFSYAGADITPASPANPCGDPRRLLSWVVNHCTTHGLTLIEQTILTTGSYTGMYFPAGPGTATGEIAGLPPVYLTLT
jgi:2-keto-4-pentenoate hydratase